MIQLKLGAKGEIVIPKKIRDSLGFIKNKPLLLNIKKGKIELVPMKKDILKKWEQIATCEGTNVTKYITYGDKLYEGIFQ